MTSHNASHRQSTSCGNSSHGNSPSRQEILLTWPRVFKRFSVLKERDSTIAVHSFKFESFLSSSPSFTSGIESEEPLHEACIPINQHVDNELQPPSTSTLLFLVTAGPTQMTSSVWASSITASHSQSSRDKLLHIIGWDSFSLSKTSLKKTDKNPTSHLLARIASEGGHSLSLFEASMRKNDKNSNSLGKRVCKTLSKAKKSINKLVQWLREIQNV